MHACFSHNTICDRPACRRHRRHNPARQLHCQGFNTELSLIRLPNLQQKAFSIGLQTAWDSITNQLPLRCHKKTPQKKRKCRIRTASLAAVREISVDAAVEAVLSPPDGIFVASVTGFHLTPNSLCQEFNTVAHRSFPSGSGRQLMLPLTPTGSLEL